MTGVGWRIFAALAAIDWFATLPVASAGKPVQRGERSLGMTRPDGTGFLAIGGIR